MLCGMARRFTTPNEDEINQFMRTAAASGELESVDPRAVKRASSNYPKTRARGVGQVAGQIDANRAANKQREEMNRQQAAQQREVAAQQRETERQGRAMAAEQERQRMVSVRANAAEGIKTTTDIQTGRRDIQRHPDGAPVFEAGPQGQPFQQAEQRKTEIPSGFVSQATQTPGAPAKTAEREVTNWKQTVRDDRGNVSTVAPESKVDPKTGEKIHSSTDPVTGQPVKTVVGIDMAAQERAKRLEQHAQASQALAMRENAVLQSKPLFQAQWGPARDEYQKRQTEFNAATKDKLENRGGVWVKIDGDTGKESYPDAKEVAHMNTKRANAEAMMVHAKAQHDKMLPTAENFNRVQQEIAAEKLRLEAQRLKIEAGLPDDDGGVAESMAARITGATAPTAPTGEAATTIPPGFKRDAAAVVDPTATAPPEAPPAPEAIKAFTSLPGATLEPAKTYTAIKRGGKWIGSIERDPDGTEYVTIRPEGRQDADANKIVRDAGTEGTPVFIADNPERPRMAQEEQWTAGVLGVRKDPELIDPVTNQPTPLFYDAMRERGAMPKDIAAKVQTGLLSVQRGEAIMREVWGDTLQAPDAADKVNFEKWIGEKTAEEHKAAQERFGNPKARAERTFAERWNDTSNLEDRQRVWVEYLGDYLMRNQGKPGVDRAAIQRMMRQPVSATMGTKAVSAARAGGRILRDNVAGSMLGIAAGLTTGAGSAEVALFGDEAAKKHFEEWKTMVGRDTANWNEAFYRNLQTGKTFIPLPGTEKGRQTITALDDATAKFQRVIDEEYNKPTQDKERIDAAESLVRQAAMDFHNLNNDPSWPVTEDNLDANKDQSLKAALARYAASGDPQQFELYKERLLMANGRRQQSANLEKKMMGANGFEAAVTGAMYAGWQEIGSEMISTAVMFGTGFLSKALQVGLKGVGATGKASRIAALSSKMASGLERVGKFGVRTDSLVAPLTKAQRVTNAVKRAGGVVTMSAGLEGVEELIPEGGADSPNNLYAFAVGAFGGMALAPMGYVQQVIGEQEGQAQAKAKFNRENNRFANAYNAAMIDQQGFETITPEQAGIARQFVNEQEFTQIVRELQRQSAVLADPNTSPESKLVAQNLMDGLRPQLANQTDSAVQAAKEISQMTDPQQRIEASAYAKVATGNAVMLTPAERSAVQASVTEEGMPYFAAVAATDGTVTEKLTDEGIAEITKRIPVLRPLIKTDGSETILTRLQDQAHAAQTPTNEQDTQGPTGAPPTEADSQVNQAQGPPPVAGTGDEGAAGGMPGDNQATQAYAPDTVMPGEEVAAAQEVAEAVAASIAPPVDANGTPLYRIEINTEDLQGTFGVYASKGKVTLSVRDLAGELIGRTRQQMHDVIYATIKQHEVWHIVEFEVIEQKRLDSGTTEDYETFRRRYLSEMAAEIPDAVWNLAANIYNSGQSVTLKVNGKMVEASNMWERMTDVQKAASPWGQYKNAADRMSELNRMMAEAASNPEQAEMFSEVIRETAFKSNSLFMTYLRAMVKSLIGIVKTLADGSMARIHVEEMLTFYRGLLAAKPAQQAAPTPPATPAKAETPAEPAKDTPPSKPAVTDSFGGKLEYLPNGQARWTNKAGETIYEGEESAIEAKYYHPTTVMRRAYLAAQAKHPELKKGALAKEFDDISDAIADVIETMPVEERTGFMERELEQWIADRLDQQQEEQAAADETPVSDADKEAARIKRREAQDRRIKRIVAKADEVIATTRWIMAMDANGMRIELPSNIISILQAKKARKETLSYKEAERLANGRGEDGIPRQSWYPGGGTNEVLREIIRRITAKNGSGRTPDDISRGFDEIVGYPVTTEELLQGIQTELRGIAKRTWKTPAEFTEKEIQAELAKEQAKRDKDFADANNEMKERGALDYRVSDFDQSKVGNALYVEGEKLTIAEVKMGPDGKAQSVVFDSARFGRQEMEGGEVLFAETGVVDEFADDVEPMFAARSARQDAEYLAAVELGDMETAQRMVDEAARAAGYDIGPVWHGTGRWDKDNQFTVFDSRQNVTVYRVNGKEVKRLDSDGESISYYDDKALDDGYHYGALTDSATIGAEKALEFRAKEEGKDSPHVRDLKRLVGKEVSYKSEERRTGDGFYFSGNENYGIVARSKTKIRAYLKLNNPARIDESAIEGAGSKWKMERLIAQGYDGAVFDAAWNPLEQVVAFYPSQIKSADPVTRDASGNIIPLSQRFNPASDSILYSSPSSRQSPFYSQLSRVLEAKMPKAAPVGQVVQIARSNSKDDEIKWSGLVGAAERLAAENGGKVPKDKLLEWLAADGAVVLEEVVAGGVDRMTAPMSAERLRRALRSDGFSATEADTVVQAASRKENAYLGRNSNISDLVQEVISDYRGLEESPNNTTRFSQYTLPGGENYREVVLAMPVKKYTLKDWFDEQGVTEEHWNSLTLSQQNKMRDDYAKSPNHDQRPKYHSTHFPDVPNYVAHMRLDDRTDSQGKPGLFVEEFQSDRHQAGRKDGYKEPDKVAEIQKEFDDHVNDMSDMPFDEYKAKELEIFTRLEKAQKGSVAPAPFATSWPLQLFKRALRDAVERGMSWIGWTTGTTQGERFDLSKQVDAINVDKTSDGQFIVKMKPKGGREWQDVDMMNEAKLADTIGKDLAQRVIDSPERRVTFEGDGLKTESAGMKGFYDNMLPKEVQAYVKQWKAEDGSRPQVRRDFVPMQENRSNWIYTFNDGSQVSTVEEAESLLSERGEWTMQPEQRKTPIWRLDITDSMRKGVMEGQPLFASKSSGNQGFFDFGTESSFGTKGGQTGFDFGQSTGNEGTRKESKPIESQGKPAETKQDTEPPQKTLKELVDEALGGSKPLSKAEELRKQADSLTKQAMKMLDGIPPGQPVSSTRDRNLRERASEMQRKASELLNQADALEPAKAPEAQPTPPAETPQAQPESLIGDKAPQQTGITDFGEKIGGARKDTATKTGTTGQAKKTNDKPGWFNRYEVNEVIAEAKPQSPLESYMARSSGIPTGDVGRFVINDKRKVDWKGNPERATRETFATREEAEAYIPIIEVSRNHRVRYEKEGEKVSYVIWRDVTDRKRVQVVQQKFDTEREAMEYMVKNAADIIETKTSWREELIAKPEKAVRVGPERRTGPATPEMFQKAFGFRGVEFGNWMRQAGDGKERQEVLNHAYDGLLDLAELLGIPPKAISLNGELGLAFGARGQGLSGAKAHYESDYVVINLTKMSGAGSLAHEWIHALDHYLGRQDGMASSEWKANATGDRVLPAASPENRMVSHGFSRKSNVREEVREAFNKLKDTIFNKAVEYVEDSDKAEAFVARSRKDLEEQIAKVRKEITAGPSEWYKRRKAADEAQLAVFDSIADRFIAGQELETTWRMIEGGKSRYGNHRHTNDALEQIGEIYKATVGRSGFQKESTGPLDYLRTAASHYRQRLKMLESAAASETKVRKVPTDYSMNAKRIDQGSASDYWNVPHEMLARAFSAYVEDRVAQTGGTSDFLSYGSNNNLPSYRLFNVKPFPEGKEREMINEEFDKLFDTIESEETGKGVRLYASRSSRDTDLESHILENSSHRQAWSDASKKLFGERIHPAQIPVIKGRYTRISDFPESLRDLATVGEVSRKLDRETDMAGNDILDIVTTDYEDGIEDPVTGINSATFDLAMGFRNSLRGMFKKRGEALKRIIDKTKGLYTESEFINIATGLPTATEIESEDRWNQVMFERKNPLGASRSSRDTGPDLFTAAANAPENAAKLSTVKVGTMSALGAYKALTAKRAAGKKLTADEEEKLLQAEQALGQKLAFDMEELKNQPTKPQAEFGTGAKAPKRAQAEIGGDELFGGQPHTFKATQDGQGMLFAAASSRAEAAEILKNAKRDSSGRLTAPNGKPTKLTDEQWAAVRTKTFKKWFGDWEKFATTEGGVWSDTEKSVSKVVDSNGEPLVVYHGSREAGFDEFAPEKAGRNRPNTVFFSDSQNTARTYSGSRDGVNFARDEYGDFDPHRAIYHVFLNIRNPNEANFEGANWDGSRQGMFMVQNQDGELVHDENGRWYFKEEYEAEALAEANDGAEVLPADDGFETTNSVANEAAQYGNDGAIIREVVDDGGEAENYDTSDVFVVFDANQVKSATDNNGDFSSNPSILFAAPSTPDPIYAAAAQQVMASLDSNTRGIFEAAKAGQSPEEIMAQFKVSEKGITNAVAQVEARIAAAMKAASPGGMDPQMKDGKIIGKPKLAYSANPLVATVDQERTKAGLPSNDGDAAIAAEGDARLVADYDGEYAKLQAKANNLDRMDKVEVYMAGQIIARETMNGIPDDPKARVAAAMFINGYRNLGSEWSAEGRMRRDRFMTPAQRNARMIAEALFTPDEATRDALNGADPSRASAILAPWLAKIDKIKAELAAKGIDIDTMLSEYAEHQAALEQAARENPEAMQAFKMAFRKLNRLEKTVITMMRDGVLAKEIAQYAVITKEEVRRILNTFDDEFADAQIEFAKKFLEKSLGAAPTNDPLRAIRRALGIYRFEEIDNFSNPDLVHPSKQTAKTRAKKKQDTKPPLADPKISIDEWANRPPSTWRTLWETEMGKLQPQNRVTFEEWAAKKFPKTARARQAEMDLGITPPAGQQGGMSLDEWATRQLQQWRTLYQGEMTGLRPNQRITFDAWAARPLSQHTAATQQSLGLDDPNKKPVSTTTGSFDINDQKKLAETGKQIAQQHGKGMDRVMEWWKASIMSGLQTPIVNMASTSAYAAYNLVPRRMMEAAVNNFLTLFGQGSKQAATFGEFVPMFKQMRAALRDAVHNAAQSWELRSRVFEKYADALAIQIEMDGSGADKMKEFIPGKLGTFIRSISFRHMTAADEFMKTYFGNLEAVAQAHRIAAVEEGLTGSAYEKRLAELSVRGKEAWKRSKKLSQITTFQQPLSKKDPKFIANIDRLALWVKQGRSLPYIGRPITFALPFIDTPTNIFKQAVEMSPLVGILSVIDGLRALRIRYSGRKLSEAELAAAKLKASELYDRARFVQDMTNQITSLIVLYVLQEMVKPDDDDEEGLPTITGTMPYRTTDQGERNNAYAVMPPMTIRIGKLQFSYARFDPFATVAASIVDWLHEVDRSGGITADTFSEWGMRFKDQVKEKTFLTGLSNIIKAAEDPKRWAERLSSSIITGFVPNLIRQPIRESQDTMRDTGPQAGDGFLTTIGKSVGYSLAPSAAPPKLDVWGNPIPANRGELIGNEGTDWLFRVMDPTNASFGSKSSPVDLWIFHWNATTEDKAARIRIEAIDDKLQIKQPGKKAVTVPLTPEEHLEANRNVGQRAKEILGDDWDWRKQAPEQAERITNTFKELQTAERARIRAEKIAAGLPTAEE